MGTTTEMTMRHLASSVEQGFRQILDSGILDAPDFIQQAGERRNDLAQKTTELVCITREVMDHYPLMSPVFLFEHGGASMVRYISEAGVALYIFPPSVSYNGNGAEIKPAFISDGFSEMLKENLYLYICDSFSPVEQLEILQAILRWYRENLLPSSTNGNRKICQCVNDLCKELQHILDSGARD